MKHMSTISYRLRKWLMENIMDHEKGCFSLQPLRVSVLCDIKLSRNKQLSRFVFRKKTAYFQKQVNCNFQTADSWNASTKDFSTSPCLEGLSTSGCSHTYSDLMLCFDHILTLSVCRWVEYMLDISSWCISISALAFAMGSSAGES